MFCLGGLGEAARGQLVISPKGTRLRADTCLWALSGTSIYNKNTGNVGIGIAAPGSILDVEQNTNAASIVQIRNNNAGAAATEYLALGNDARAQQGVIFVNSSANTTNAGANSLNIRNTTAAPIAFSTNSAERMRIDGTGKVGIGTSAATNTLEVNSGTAATSGITLTQLTGAAAQSLGVSSTGVVGIYNPVNKQFVTQTSGGATLTSPTVYPATTEIAENAPFNATKWTGFANMTKALIVNSTSSVVTFSICGGATVNVTVIGALGTTTNEFAVGLFVDGVLRSVKNIVNISITAGADDFTINATGSVTGLTAGSHTFSIGILPRVRNNTTDWYLFSNASGIGGFAEFPNRATTVYNVIDQ